MENNSKVITLLSSNDNSTMRLAKRCMKITVCALFVLLIASIMFISGIGWGNEVLYYSMLTDEERIAEKQDTMINMGVIDVAEAASNLGVGGNYTSLNYSITPAYTSSHMATSSSNSNEKTSASSGEFSIWSDNWKSGDRRVAAHMYLKIGGNLLSYASSGMLKVYVNGYVGTKKDSSSSDVAMCALVSSYQVGTSGGQCSGTNKQWGTGWRGQTLTLSSTNNILILGIQAFRNAKWYASWNAPGVYFDSITLNFTTSDSTAPTIQLQNYMSSNWQNSRSVNFTTSDNAATTYIPYAYIRNGTSTLNTYSNFTRGSTQTVASSNYASNLTGYIRDWKNNSTTNIKYYTGSTWTTSTSISNYYLKIDVQVPAGGAIKFFSSVPTKDKYDRGADIISSPNKNMIYVGAYITDDRSGISKVILKNNTNGTTYEYNKIDGKYSLSTTETGTNSYAAGYSKGLFYAAVPNNKANGSWSLEVSDYTYNTSGSYTPNKKTTSATFYWADNSAPVISNISFSYLKQSNSSITATSPTGSSTSYSSATAAGAAAFANSYITMSFTITDTTGSSTNYPTGVNYSSYVDTVTVYGYKNAKVSYTVTKGTAVYNGSANPANRTYNCSVTLPYRTVSTLYTVGSNSSCSGYTIYCQDRAGNERTATNIHVNIDSVAPIISRISITGTGVSAVYTKGSTTPAVSGTDIRYNYTSSILTLTVSATDIQDTGSNYNNGSGIDRIYIYRLNPNGTIKSQYALKSGLSTTSTSASFTLNENSNLSFFYKVIVFDKAGNSSEWSNASWTGGGISYTNANDSGGIKTFYALRDDITPTITFKYTDLNGVAQSISYTSNEAKNYTFVFPWSKSGSTSFQFMLTSGPSGGSLYDVDAGNIVVSGSTIARGVTSGSPYSVSGTNIGNNSITASVTKTAIGSRDWHFKFTNNASASVDSITVQTRLDSTGPGIKLVGFGTLNGGSFSTEAEVKAAISNYHDEAYYLNNTASGWRTVEASSPVYGIFIVTDGMSGVSTGSDKYGLKTSAGFITGNAYYGNQASKAKSSVTFSHNGYTYTNNVSYENYGSVWLVRIKMWDLNDIRNYAKKSGVSIYNNSTGLYDLANGTRLRYNIKMYDFLENLSNASMQGGSTNLEYCVDPFPIGVTAVSAVKDYDSGNGTYYSYSGDWTRNDVYVYFSKQVSLTPTRVQYGYVNINDNGGVVSDTPTGYVSSIPAGYSTWLSLTEDSDASETAYLKLLATSRSVQLFFRVYNYCQESTWVKYSGNYVYVRQDTTPPILQEVAFSKNPTFTIGQIDTSNTELLLHYIYDNVNNTWTRLPTTAASAVWTVGSNIVSVLDDAAKAILFTENRAYQDGVYMYIKATDKLGEGGSGSGINNIAVTFNGTTTTLKRVVASDYTTKKYKSLAATSYTNTTISDSMYFNGSGSGLFCSFTKLFGYTNATQDYSVSFRMTDNQNNVKTVSVAKSNLGGKQFLPVVDNIQPLITLNSATAVGSYLNGGGKMSGESVRVDVNMKLNIINGNSGAKLYYRLGNYQERLPATDSYVVNNTSTVPFGFIAQTPGISGWTELTSFGTSNNGIYDNKISKNYSYKNRYDLLLVTGTNAYYYFDSGDVFIDTVPPVIDASKTFFSRTSDANSTALIGVVTYNGITANVYTNDNIYAYFYIYDTASGIAPNGVWYAKSATENVYLDIVNVKGLDGINRDYYRLLLDSKKNYKINAVDNATNVSASGEFNPNIDKTPVTIAINAYLNDSITAYNILNNADHIYTNAAKIKVKISVNYGPSGFAGVQTSTDGGAHWDFGSPSTAQIGGASWVKTDGANQSTITFYHTNEQHLTYTFKAYNGITESYATDGIRPTGTNNMTISIDRTAPKIDLTKGNYNELISKWTNIDQTLQVYVQDYLGLNVGGSGINSVSLSYKVGNEAKSLSLSRIIVNEEICYSTDENAVQLYADYTIVMVDNAGNSFTKGFRPLIDKVMPSFGNYTDDIPYHIFEDSTATRWYSTTGAKINWSKNNLDVKVNMVYSISGAELYYLSASEAITDFSQSTWTKITAASASWGINPPMIKDGGTTATKADMNYDIDVAEGKNSVKYHYLKIVSNAGSSSEVLSLGQIHIDREVPTINVKAGVGKLTIKDNNITNCEGILTNIGNLNGDRWIFDSWTSSNITMFVQSASTLISNYTICYRIGNNAWNTISPDYATLGETIYYSYGKDNNAVPDATKMKFSYTVSGSTNKVTYQYKLISGSGLESTVFSVEEVKIDQQTPQFSIYAVKSNELGTAHANTFNITTADKYNSYFSNSNKYEFTGAEWTKSTSVILKVSSISCGYSGATLQFSRTKNGAGIYGSFQNYESFSANTTNSDLYYVVAATELNMAFRLVSGSGLSAQKEGSVKIDKDIPIVYVKSITGTKASNWNAATENINKWYTSKVTITLGVGRYYYDTDNYVFENDTSADGDEIVSGYTIYYNDGNDWINNGTVVSLDVNDRKQGEGNSYVFETIIMKTYRFKIVSGSGMEFVLGEAAKNNIGNDVISIAGINSLMTAQSGIVSNLNDTDFYYSFNVDSKEYTISGTHNMELYVNNNSFLWTNGAEAEPIFSADAVTKSNNGTISGSFVSVNITDLFKRGDYVRITHNSAAPYNYLLRYTDYGVKGKDANNNDILVNAERLLGEENETNGTFDLFFNGESFAYVSYFMKAVDVTYENTIIYLQNDGLANVIASSEFKFLNDGTENTLNLSFNYIYKDMNDNAVNLEELEVNGYLVTVSIKDANKNSFRLNNPSTVLLVKYFTEKLDEEGNEIANSTINPYTILTEEDMNRISTEYFDAYTENNGVFTLAPKKSYLESHYIVRKQTEKDVNGIIQKENLPITLILSEEFNGIEDNFTGTFNAFGSTISLYGGTSANSFLFNKVGGEVSNLILNLQNPLNVVDTSNIGILANEIDGGTVKNIKLTAQIRISSVPDGALVGGITAYAKNAHIGENNEPIFVDIDVVNGGSNIKNVVLGGIAAHIAEGTVLRYTYVYGNICLYNIQKVSPDENAAALSSVGMTFGKIDSYVTAENRSQYFFNNYYLDKATFVNNAAVLSYSNKTNIVNDVNETQNTIRKKTYEEFVGVGGEGQIGGVEIFGQAIRSIVLQKLYRDFNYLCLEKVGDEVYESFNYGEGTIDSPLIIDSLAHLEMIDNYVTLYFVLINDIDMYSFNEPIAKNKVFYGSLDGDGYTLNNFGAGVNSVNDNAFGLFARLDGTVCDFVFSNIDIDVQYTGGENKFFAGLIAGEATENANIHQIIAIGSTSFESVYAELMAGGVVGRANGGSIYDVFTLNNLKATGKIITAGGIVGYANNTKLAINKLGNAAAIFSIGRVEVLYDNAVSIGAVVGDGMISFDSNNAKIFVLESNTYSNGNEVSATIGSDSGTFGMAMTEFTDPNSVMRGTFFSDNTTNAFSKVFGTDENRLYPLAGFGTTNSKFIIRSNIENSAIKDFRYINQALYASYNIAGDVTFSSGEFETIGKGLVFTGSIDGKNADSISAEDGSVSSLMNVTDSLIYNNNGTVSDLGVNIYYSKEVIRNENDDDYDLTFGAIAVMNSGVIRNVTVSGEISVTSAIKNTTVVVSGFVGIDKGGIIEGDSKIQNSISGLNISIDNAMTVYAGGYVGIVDGMTALSYGIGSGSLTVTNSGTYYVGTLIGETRYVIIPTALVASQNEYQYQVTVNGEIITDMIGVENY